MKKSVFCIFLTLFVAAIHANVVSIRPSAHTENLPGVQIEPIENLAAYGDALNIEGGLIPKRELNKNQIWANVCFVLDCPLLEKSDLDEITAKNTYRLKESSILNYNENQAALIQALILKYYLTKGDASHIVLNVHRNSSGPKHLDDLEKILAACLEGIEKMGKRKFRLGSKTLELTHGVQHLSGYAHADCVISISLVAGLNPEWPSGTALIPEKFTPFDVHSMIVAKSGAYTVKNHLREVLEEVLALQDSQLIGSINRTFSSPNRKKSNLRAFPLTENDFKKSQLLQASGMFYPKQLPDTFEVY